MPSDAAKKRQQQKRLAQDKKREGGRGKATGGTSLEPKSRSVGASPESSSYRSCTSVLTSHPLSRDLHLERLSLTFHGAELLTDAKLELNCGRRYGLLGLNGSGK